MVLVVLSTVNADIELRASLGWRWHHYFGQMWVALRNEAQEQNSPKTKSVSSHSQEPAHQAPSPKASVA